MDISRTIVRYWNSIINVGVHIMDFREYQTETHKTAIFPPLFLGEEELTFIYPALGLEGEVGEVAEHIKKIIRDDGGYISEDRKNKVTKELGDVLWYISELATALSINLDYVAKSNIEKLKDRMNRGVLQGEGDTR